MLHFDADVKNTTARHQCENRYTGQGPWTHWEAFARRTTHLSTLHGHVSSPSTKTTLNSVMQSPWSFVLMCVQLGIFTQAGRRPMIGVRRWRQHFDAGASV